MMRDYPLGLRQNGVEREPFHWSRLFGVEWVILWLWLIVFAIYVITPLSDPDTPWHLATGSYILAHHQIPTTDPFSWTMRGKPWVTQEWLFEVCLAWMAKHLGYLGVWLVLVLVHSATVLVLYALGVKASGGQRVIAALLACASTATAMAFWTVRPQILSYCLFAVFLLILEQVRQERLWVLWLVPLFIWFWANVHASVSMGILMLLVEVVISFVPDLGRLESVSLSGRARLGLVAAATGGIALGLVNPNHVKEFTYALLSTNPLMTNNIMEWHSPNFHTSYFKYDVLPFLLIAFFILLSRRRSIRLRETLYFGGALALTLIHQRFMPYFAITAVPLLADSLEDMFSSLLSPALWMSALNAILIAACFVVFGTRASGLAGSVDAHMSKTAYPVAAVNYLEQHPISGHLLNSYQYGGYLIYRGIPTFVDGRTDIYLQNSTFSDYLAMQNVWWNCAQLLQQYHITAVLFPTGQSLVSYLESQPNWRVVYSDSTAVLLEKM